MNNQPNIETNIAKNIPTVDYTTCIDTFKKIYGDNNYHVASINFNRNLLSSITDGALNTSSVYSLIYDTEKNIYSSDECKKLNVYFPDPAVNDILNDIMEWYICSKIYILQNKSNIIHTGLAHSQNVIKLLIWIYKYNIETENGINVIDKNFDNIKTGCVNIISKYDKLFG